MGRRQYCDRGKELRRFRLALFPDEWAWFDKRAAVGYFGPDVRTQIEGILTKHAAASIDAAAAAEPAAPDASTGWGLEGGGDE